jgi:hypothetical protein
MISILSSKRRITFIQSLESGARTGEPCLLQKIERFLNQEVQLPDLESRLQQALQFLRKSELPQVAVSGKTRNALVLSVLSMVAASGLSACSDRNLYQGGSGNTRGAGKSGVTESMVPENLHPNFVRVDNNSGNKILLECKPLNIGDNSNSDSVSPGRFGQCVEGVKKVSIGETVLDLPTTGQSPLTISKNGQGYTATYYTPPKTTP